MAINKLLRIFKNGRNLTDETTKGLLLVHSLNTCEELRQNEGRIMCIDRRLHKLAKIYSSIQKSHSLCYKSAYYLGKFSKPLDCLYNYTQLKKEGE